MIFPIGYRGRRFRHYGSPPKQATTFKVVALSILALSIPLLMAIAAVWAK